MGQPDEQVAGQDAKASKRGRLRGNGPRMRQVVVAAGIIGVVAAPMGVAATGGALREGVRNGTTTAETEIVSDIKATTGLKGGYSTRQSNLSATGGGAIYGCRSTAGTSGGNPPQNPCVRANNLKTGLAFEFNATSGNVVGTITASGAGGDSVKPFVTNATGVATGLNADRVDGQDAAAIAKTATDASATDATTKANAARTRFALINEAGQIEEQSGGFTVKSFNAPNNNNVYIDTGSSLVSKGLQATIALQNRVNVNGNADPDPNFSGEVSVARCNTPAVACAPEGTNNDNTLVVRASNSDGTATAAGERKRFYVTVTP